MKLKTLKFLMLTAISAIALSVSTHAYSQTATPTQGFVATVAEVRSYPTKFPVAEAKGIPVKSLAKIIEIDKADPTNRIPYGQRYIEASQNTAITDEEGAATKATLKTTATNALNQLFETNNISVLIVPTNEVFAHAPSGFPALDIPSGFSPKGEPQGIKLVGRYLGESDIIAVGYAYEQATLARKAPNLNATIATFKNLNQAVPKKY
ncbi:MAG: hypothetical protein V7K77_09715 [Nostoc sp.]|uniref:hypothetical protein n=1 Tax=Nostoc sp. TaxID=1180 RepID=UPI002FF5C35A